MAATENVGIIVSAVDRASSVFKKIGSAIDRTINGQIDRLNSATEKFQSRMEKAANISMAASGVQGFADKVTGALKAPIEAGMNFQQAMSKVGAISLSGHLDAAGKPTDEYRQKLESLTRTAEEWGAKTAWSATQIAEGMSFLGMAGFNSDQIAASMGGLLNTASAAGIDLATTADIVSNIGSAFFGADAANQMERMGDVMVATFTSSNVSLEMLGETMKYAAPVAAQTGVSLEKLAAMTGALGDVGIQGSMAGTAIRSSLSRLADAPKPAADALKFLGVQTRDTAGNLRDIPTILKEISAAMDAKKLGTAQRAGLMADIAGLEAMSGFSVLVQDAGSGKLDKKIAALGEEGRNVAGISESVATNMMDNLKGDLTILDSVTESLHITIFNAVSSSLRMLVQGATKFTGFVNDLARRFPGLTQAVVGFVAAFAGIATVVATVLLGFSAITSVSAVLAVGLSALAAFAIPIAAIGTAGLLIYRNWQPIASFFEGFWTGFSTAIEPVLISLDPMINFFSALLAPVQASTDSINNFASAGQKVGIFVASFINRGIGMFTAFASGIASGASIIYNAVLNAFRWVIRLFPGSDAEEGPFSNLTERGKGMLRALGDGVLAGMGWLKDKLTYVFTLFLVGLDTVKEKLQNSGIQGVASAIFTPIANGISAMLSSVTSFITSYIPSQVFAAIGTVGGHLGTLLYTYFVELPATVLANFSSIFGTITVGSFFINLRKHFSSLGNAFAAVKNGVLGVGTSFSSLTSIATVFGNSQLTLGGKIKAALGLVKISFLSLESGFATFIGGVRNTFPFLSGMFGNIGTALRVVLLNPLMRLVFGIRAVSETFKILDFTVGKGVTDFRAREAAVKRLGMVWGTAFARNPKGDLDFWFSMLEKLSRVAWAFVKNNPFKFGLFGVGIFLFKDVFIGIFDALKQHLPMIKAQLETFIDFTKRNFGHLIDSFNSVNWHAVGMVIGDALGAAITVFLDFSNMVWGVFLMIGEGAAKWKLWYDSLGGITQQVTKFGAILTGVLVGALALWLKFRKMPCPIGPGCPQPSALSRFQKVKQFVSYIFTGRKQQKPPCTFPNSDPACAQRAQNAQRQQQTFQRNQQNKPQSPCGVAAKQRLPRYPRMPKNAWNNESSFKRESGLLSFLRRQQPSKATGMPAQDRLYPKSDMLKRAKGGCMSDACNSLSRSFQRMPEQFWNNSKYFKPPATATGMPAQNDFVSRQRGNRPASASAAQPTASATPSTWWQRFWQRNQPVMQQAKAAPARWWQRFWNRSPPSMETPRPSATATPRTTPSAVPAPSRTASSMSAPTPSWQHQALRQRMGAMGDKWRASVDNARTTGSGELRQKVPDDFQSIDRNARRQLNMTGVKDTNTPQRDYLDQLGRARAQITKKTEEINASIAAENSKAMSRRSPFQWMIVGADNAITRLSMIHSKALGVLRSGNQSLSAESGRMGSSVEQAAPSNKMSMGRKIGIGAGVAAATAALLSFSQSAQGAEIAADNASGAIDGISDSAASGGSSMGLLEQASAKLGQAWQWLKANSDMLISGAFLLMSTGILDLGSVFSGLSSIFSSGASLIVQNIGMIGSSFAVLAAAFAGWQIGSWIYNNVPIVREGAIAIVGSIVEIVNNITSLAGQMYEAGKNFIMNLLNGIMSLGGQIKQAVFDMLPSAAEISNKIMGGVKAAQSSASSWIGDKVDWITGQQAANTAALGGVQKRAKGGLIRGAGTTTSDSIPAFLSNNEYVMPAHAVAKFGVGFFDSLRSGEMPSKLASGAGAIKSDVLNKLNNIKISDVLNNPKQVLSGIGDSLSSAPKMLLDSIMPASNNAAPQSIPQTIPQIAAQTTQQSVQGSTASTGGSNITIGDIVINMPSGGGDKAQFDPMDIAREVKAQIEMAMQEAVRGAQYDL